MSLKNDRYTYRVTWSEDDNEYVGLCTEFPSLSWLAKTPEATLKGIRKVVSDIVEDMQRTGETVPNPLAGKHYSGKFVEFEHQDIRGEAADRRQARRLRLWWRQHGCCGSEHRGRTPRLTITMVRHQRLKSKSITFQASRR